MAKLKYEDCPGVSQKRVDSVNSLSDEQLQLEIDKGRHSVYKEAMIPVLKLALKKRTEVVERQNREEELDIARGANKIAESALEQAKIANDKADQARYWSGLAVLITVVIAAIGWLRNG